MRIQIILIALPALAISADSPLQFNRIFGGSGLDFVTAIATDPSGFVIVSGSTSSLDFPVTDGSRNTATQFASTRNAGASWAPVGNLPAGRPLGFRIDTSTPSVWYAPSTKGLFRSTDQGATWTEFGPFPGCVTGCIQSLAIAPMKPSTLYGSVPGGILKSTDAGAIWMRLPMPIEDPNPPGYVVLDPLEADHVFTAQRNHSYRSFDGGLTWSEITEAAPHPQGFCSTTVTFDAVIPGLTYLSDHCDLFRSRDGGLTWQAMATPFSGMGGFPVAHPTRSGNLFVILPQGLFATYDAGNSWTQLLAWPTPPRTLAIDPAHPDTILTSDQRSVDGGQTWSPLGLGTTPDVIRFDPANPGRAIVLGSGTSTAFLAKLNSAGDIMAATYLGGQGGASIASIATDPAGNIYVTGTTSSFDFPITTGAARPNAAYNPFAAKLDPDLNLVYATFAAGITQVRSIAVDASGSAVVLGFNFPANICQLVRLTPDGADAVFTKQFSSALCTAVAIDTAGNIVATGANGHATVAKFDSGGNPIFAKSFSGYNQESADSVAVDAAGNIFILGTTQSADLPVTAGAYQATFRSDCSITPIYGGGIGPGIGVPYRQEMFVTKLDPGGNPIYFTYLGTGCDSARQIALNASGNAWIVGTTNSTKFPQTAAFESGPPAGGSGKGVVTALRADGTALDLSSFFSGAYAIAVDVFGNIWVGGAAGGHASIGQIQTQYPAPLAIRTVGNAFGRRNGPVSPGQITLVTLDGFVPDAPRDFTLTPADPLPHTISGTQVLFDGEPAAMVSVSAGQIVAVAPYDIAGHPQVTVQVSANGQLSTPMRADVLADAAYLTADGSGSGRAFALNPDGSVNSPDSPAPGGRYVTVFATGIGPADPSCAEGSVATQAAPAPNGYASAVGYLCGVYQIAFLTPPIAGNVGIGNTGLTVAVK